MTPFIDRILDATVLRSFDRAGFLRHQAAFRPGELSLDLEGKTCLVTGANSGIGLATARALAARHAAVWLLCRDRTRGEAAVDAIRKQTGNDAVWLEQVDVAELAQVRALAERFPAASIDVLVHNAGVLPERRSKTREGHEVSFATNVLGPFLLTHLLLPRLKKARQARVIFVSSGGMYLLPLEIEDPEFHHRRYDGVLAYAEAKRAQVVLAELFAERRPGGSVSFASMHPGWADTPSVRSSIPRFHRWMRNRLRTPEEGADTVVWLASAAAAADASGRFWFDRAPQPTHLFPWTHETPAARRRLWELCVKLTQAPSTAPATLNAGAASARAPGGLRG